MNEKRNKIAEKLKELRIAKGLSQKQLGELLNCSNHCINKWECAKREPSLDNVIKIAEIFLVSTDYILGVTDF